MKIAVYVHTKRAEKISTKDKDAEKISLAENLDAVDDDFLQLVEEHYNDAVLFEWQPAPPPVSKPDEPGNLGTKYIIVESNFYDRCMILNCIHVQEPQ